MKHAIKCIINVVNSGYVFHRILVPEMESTIKQFRSLENPYYQVNHVGLQVSFKSVGTL